MISRGRTRELVHAVGDSLEDSPGREPWERGPRDASQLCLASCDESPLVFYDLGEAFERCVACHYCIMCTRLHDRSRIVTGLV